MSNIIINNKQISLQSSQPSQIQGNDDLPRFIGNKPVLALKRFANDLDNSTNPDASKFKELNRLRVENFIKKPIDDNIKLHNSFHPDDNNKYQKNGLYDYTEHIQHKTLHLDAPELQRSLGPRSRFGDGDGSFWDQWINTEMPSKGLGVDEKGLPISGLSDVATLGFKRLYMNRSTPSDKQSIPKPRTRVIVQPYSERKAKRLSEENQSNQQNIPSQSIPTSPLRMPTTSQSLSPFHDSLTELSLSEANWSEIEHTIDEIQLSKSHGESKESFSLPPISALERDAYFGKKARAEFLDIYRQLSRQQHIFRDSRFITNSEPLPSLSPSNAQRTPKRPKKLVRGKSGRFMVNDDSSTDSKSASSPAASFKTLTKAGMQTFGKSGILVRTNTSTADSDLQQSEISEKLVLKSHLSVPNQPGAFGRPLSPRSRFLLGCLSTGVAPRPSLLIRKEVTSTLSLEHQCMSDHGGLLLAESLKDLPYLAELNVSDNKLTDVGLTSIIKALHDCPYLTSLDVSENKIDSEAAAALSTYLTSPECKLVNLVLRKSDVDDNEIGRFIQAIVLCETLRNIDLSSNLLGSNQNRKPLHPELTSGGKVIGSLLQDPKCKIQSLKLAWNMIRFDSAVALMSSLKESHSLTYLDLSYNGIGQDGAEVLGNSLHYNKTLKKILLSNNNITPRGCFCIITGIRTNKVLEYIDLSNNPIGERGLHITMKLITEYGDRISIDLRGCSIRTKESTCWYNIERPDDLKEYPRRNEHTGVLLNLSQPYDRAVAIELLKVSARSRGRLKLDSLKLLSSDQKFDSKSGQLLNLELVSEKISQDYIESILPSNEITTQITNIINSLSLTSTSSTSHKARFFDEIEKYYMEITKPYERNKKLNVLLTSKLFERIGLNIQDNEWIVYLLFSAYDITHEGYVTLEEIKEYLVSYIKEYLDERYHNIELFNEMSYYKLSTDKDIPYNPSEIGLLYCNPIVIYDVNKQTQAKNHLLLNKYHLDNIFNSLKLTDNVFHVIESSLINTSMTFTEAWAMYNVLLKDCGDQKIIVKKLLPLLSNIYEARLFLHQALENDIESRVQLRLSMGPLYKLCVGHITGHYILHFSDITDRYCFETLWDISKNSINHRKEELMGDTSQLGDWSSFRNVIFNSIPFIFSDNFILHLPDTGKIEFDFIYYDTKIGNCYNSQVLSEHRYHDILKKLQLFPQSHPPMEEEEVITAMGFDDLLRSSFNIEDVQRDENLFDVPGGDSLPNQIITGHIEADRIFDYLIWCEDSLSNRERSIFPKKFVPPPKSAKPPSRDTKPSPFSRVATWKSSAMYTRSFDEYELESSRGNTPRTNPSRSATPRPNIIQAVVPPLTAEVVIETIGYQNLTCRQLGFILYRMSIQDQEMFSEGMRKPYGSTRVEVFITLYNQIIDVINLPCLLKFLTPHEKAVIILRLGWLNIWNPLRPNGIYRLRFNKKEERQLIRLLIVTSLLRTEEEWNNGKLIESPSNITELKPINESGCIIPLEWHKEENLPTTGVLSFEFTSKESESNLLKLNEPLLSFVLPTLKYDERNQHKKHENIHTSLTILQNEGISLEIYPGVKNHK